MELLESKRADAVRALKSLKDIQLSVRLRGMRQFNVKVLPPPPGADIGTTIKDVFAIVVSAVTVVILAFKL